MGRIKIDSICLSLTLFDVVIWGEHDQSLSLKVELTDSTSLIDQRELGICLSLSSRKQVYRCVSPCLVFM